MAVYSIRRDCALAPLIFRDDVPLAYLDRWNIPENDAPQISRDDLDELADRIVSLLNFEGRDVN